MSHFVLFRSAKTKPMKVSLGCVTCLLYQCKGFWSIIYCLRSVSNSFKRVNEISFPTQYMHVSFIMLAVYIVKCIKQQCGVYPSVCFSFLAPYLKNGAVFIEVHTHTHTQHTTVLRLFGFCPGQPGWAVARKKHSLTHTHHGHQYPYLLPPSSTIHDILSVKSTCFTDFFHNLSPSFLCSTSWPGTLHFIVHTFLHPIIIFFLQHMPIPSQPVLL